MTAWIHLILLAVVCSVGDALFKKAAASPTPYTSWSFVFGSIIYGTCGYSWVIVLRSMKLAIAGVLFSVVWSVALTVLGFALFREHLSPKEWCGIILGVLAICLLSTGE